MLNFGCVIRLSSWDFWSTERSFYVLAQAVECWQAVASAIPSMNTAMPEFDSSSWEDRQAERYFHPFHRKQTRTLCFGPSTRWSRCSDARTRTVSLLGALRRHLEHREIQGYGCNALYLLCLPFPELPVALPSRRCAPWRRCIKAWTGKIGTRSSACGCSRQLKSLHAAGFAVELTVVRG